MFSGSMTALVTPMLPDGSLDKAAFTRLVTWQLAEGTDALVVLGTTGEAATLQVDEKQFLVEEALRLADGRCPVIVGAGSNATEASMASCRQASSWGADALLVVTPYYNRPTQAGLVAHYTALAEETPLPIILYNVPHRTGCDLLPETVIRLSQLPTIAAIKEATGDLTRVEAIVSQAPDCVVLSGDDATAAEAVLRGAKGVISVSSNVVPGLMYQLMALALQGDRTAVEALQERLMPLFQATGVVSNPIPVKWMLEQMGFISSGIRLPLLPLESEHHAAVLAVMQALDLRNPRFES